MSKLLYRWSETDKKSESFYDKCVGQAPTICFVLTSKDRIWGMYTDIAWKNTGGWIKGNSNSQCFNFDEKGFHSYKVKPGKYEVGHHKNSIFHLCTPFIYGIEENDLPSAELLGHWDVHESGDR